MMRRAEGSYEAVFDARIALPLWTTTRFQTSITLPNGEKVWKANASDDDDWEVTWVKKSNLVFVKPFFPNATTAVNVITYSGNHYTFRATSDTANAGNEPMLLLDVLPPAWMKAKLLQQQDTGKQGGAPKGRSGAIAAPSEGPGDGEEDLVPASEVEKARRGGFEAGAKAGEDKAMARRDEELREYAYSIFHNANDNYKWSGDTKELRLKKAFDDGRVTYLIFESAMNIQPAFWEISGGERKDVRSQRPTFASDVVIIGKLFKEGTLSLGPKVEIKITNRGWTTTTSKGPAQTPVRVEGDHPAAKGTVQ
jgi:type IV secretory pathway VirB9-like protein